MIPQWTVLCVGADYSLPQIPIPTVPARSFAAVPGLTMETIRQAAVRAHGNSRVVDRAEKLVVQQITLPSPLMIEGTLTWNGSTNDRARRQTTGSFSSFLMLCYILQVKLHDPSRIHSQLLQQSRLIAPLQLKVSPPHARSQCASHHASMQLPC